MTKHTTNVIRLAAVTAALLMVPLVAMQFTDEVVWTLSDFVFAGVLIFGTGLLLLLAIKMTANNLYRAAAGLALAATFLLIWVNGAVGIIGDSDINTLYAGVPLAGILGALASNFQPHGMARTLFAMAIVQALIPVVALIINQPDFSPGVVGVLVLNSVWVVLFITSGVMFQRAGKQLNGAGMQSGRG
jgi:hypothetical protein